MKKKKHHLNVNAGRKKDKSKRRERGKEAGGGISKKIQCLRREVHLHKKEKGGNGANRRT